MGPGNRPLDLDWLEDFVALANSGNFSRAAEVRSIAQPAFSRHIRSLEEWVGVDLVDRSAHPVELTAAGKKFLSQIQPIMSSLEAARIKARAAQDASMATLRFASTHSLSVLFFPKWVGVLESRLRLGPIHTMTDNLQSCEDLMLQRRVQFLLCYGHVNAKSRLDDTNYPMAVLGVDRLMPVSVSNGSGQALFHLEQSGVIPLLEYSEASGLGRVVRAHLREGLIQDDRAANKPNFGIVFTAHNAFLLKSMVMSGRGIAWLPESLIEEELGRGQLKAAGGAEWSIPIEIRLYRQGAEMAQVAEDLWSLVNSANP